ncbi:MAG: translocation/assembly module TamB domain-containing protein [Geobacteraceae bacterium]|nr:translocation/assembly module TamB domain-containing protein [Geobacteraceae bacterium]
MRRLTRHLLAVAMAIILAGAAGAAVSWVVATTQGSRWLLETLLPLSGVSFSAHKIEGRIIDHLLLSGVRIGLSQQRLELDRLELRWKPLLLLSGTIAVQDLVLDGVRIQDDAPHDSKPPDLAWPRVSETGQLFDGIITRLRVTDLSYRRLRDRPVQLTSLAGTLTWQDSILSIKDLALLSPAAGIRGSVSAGFKQPSLTSDLAIALTQPLAGMNRFSILTRHSRGAGPEPFVAMFTLAGSTATRQLVELSGELGLARHAINLRHLSLVRPGQKGAITAEGSLAVNARESRATLQIRVAGLDLAPDLHLATDLTGTLKFAGTLDNYRGDLALTNRSQDWQATTVSARYHGTRAGLQLAPFNATLLDGSLAGNLNVDWRNGFALQGALRGRDLNPARLDPNWRGKANFDARGHLAWTATAPLTASVSAALLESTLHGQALTGALQADISHNNLSIARLALHGKGFDLQASGELNQRIGLAAQISDLSRLVPGSAGKLQATGWLRWRDGQLSGAVDGMGNKLAYAGAQVAAARLTAGLGAGEGYPLHASAALKNVLYDGYTLDAVTLTAEGTLQQHRLNATLQAAGSRAQLSLKAGYQTGIWKGEISRLAGRDRNGPWTLTAPAQFAVGSGTISLSPLTMAAGATERIELSLDLGLQPLSGQVRSQWTGVNLSRANAYLKDVRLSGSSNGQLRIGFLPGRQLAIAGRTSAAGTYTGQGGSIAIQRSLLTFDGSPQGTRAALDLATADGGTLRGSFSSPAALRLAMPEKGHLTADVNSINLALLTPWLPADTRLEGRISGRAAGNLLPDQRFELDGTARLSGGTLHQQRPGGELNLAFSSASAAWDWRGDALSGNLALVMTRYGQARGTFQLPLAARWPLSVDPKGAVRGSLVGQVQEKGIITTLFPGFVQESSGELSAELDVNGSWAAPQINGKLRLAKADAYLPTAGIHLKDMQLAARLDKNLIRIDSFRAVSGPGHLEGQATITLNGWQVTGYSGSLRGENFQTVYFPELQVLSTPALSFEGTPHKLTVRGDVQLPELRVVGAPSRTVITPSSDVIREGRTGAVATGSPLALDIQVRVLLGEKVFVKVAGIDARLGGALELSATHPDRITSRGEIKVLKGRYRTYGVNLDITRGRLFFAGGTITNPSLDFLALRTIGDIRAGVTVAGTLQRPVTKLYSEPAMPDVDVLAYIVLGHPLGSNGQQTDLVSQAAGALLSTGQASELQEKLRNYLGLSTLEVQGGVGGTTNAMGYKPLQVTPPGSIPAAQLAGVTDTMLTVGKYLTPKLYISYGRSLFSGNNLFRLRYDIFRKWQIETQTGNGESGADIYYKLEFK